MRQPVTRQPRDAAGFTLIEVMVAIGLFGLLMAMVSVLMINGIRSLRVASTANIVQAQQQNAMLAMTRQLKYIDNPTQGTNPPAAILQATPTAMAFYTLSGTGNVDRLPYKVMMCTTTRGVETFTWAPALTNGGAVLNASPNMTVPTCDDAGASGSSRRVLLPNDQDTAPTLGFTYWRARTAADGAGTGDIQLIPSGALTTAQIALLTKVKVRVSDPALGSPLEQTVVLVNDRTK